MLKANNSHIVMTRRYPDLPKKVLIRDSKIVERLVHAYDVEKDLDKTLALYLKECKNLSDERYWELMRTVWVICGNSDNADVFRGLMKSKRKQRYYFSTPEEAKFLRELPEMFTVYRATNMFKSYEGYEKSFLVVPDESDKGISWTLDTKYAEKFKQMYNKQYIIHRQVNRADVFAYIERNLESEIIIL